MQFEQDNATDKQAYNKPKLRVIELATEEVLGVGCKIVSGMLAVNNTIRPWSCTTPTNCFNAGS